MATACSVAYTIPRESTLDALERMFGRRPSPSTPLDTSDPKVFDFWLKYCPRHTLMEFATGEAF